jgi:hypothetical protein
MCPLLISEEYWVSKQVLSFSHGVGKPVCNCCMSGVGRWGGGGEAVLTFTLEVFENGFKNFIRGECVVVIKVVISCCI